MRFNVSSIGCSTATNDIDFHIGSLFLAPHPWNHSCIHGIRRWFYGSSFKVVGLASMRRVKWHDEITHSSVDETNVHGWCHFIHGWYTSTNGVQHIPSHPCTGIKSRILIIALTQSIHALPLSKNPEIGSPTFAFPSRNPLIATLSVPSLIVFGHVDSPTLDQLS